MQVSLNGSNLVTLASQQDIPLGIAVEVIHHLLGGVHRSARAPARFSSAPVGGGTITTLVANA